MRNLIFKGNPEDNEGIPEVMLCFEKGECTIAGECYPIDVKLEQIFVDIHTWLVDYFRLKNHLLFHINLDYCNSLTERKLQELISYLDKESQKGKDINLKWFFQKDDTNFKEDIEDILKNVSLKFNLIEV